MAQHSMWRIYVPTIRNDGRPFHLRYHRVWDKRVREITGGLTINGPVKGQWTDRDGEVYNERMIPVDIAATKPQIERIGEMTASYYEQKEVLIYKISDEVISINRETRRVKAPIPQGTVVSAKLPWGLGVGDNKNIVHGTVLMAKGPFGRSEEYVYKLAIDSNGLFPSIVDVRSSHIIWRSDRPYE